MNYTKSFTIYQSDISISANIHTCQRLVERGYNKESIASMVKIAIPKMELKETYAIIKKEDKVIAIRSQEKLVFVITCLDKNQYVKNGTKKIFIEGW